MTLAEMVRAVSYIRAVSHILPNCTVGEDNDGQIVIYTGLYEKVSPTGAERDKDPQLVPFDDK
jgi:hypothetical protein